MINFQNTLVKLVVFNADGTPVNGYAARVQYFDFATQAWADLYDSAISKGGLYIQGDVDDPISSEIPFFDYIRDGQIPNMRILPGKRIATGTEIQEVIASTHAFLLNDTAGIYTFDFGTLWLVPDEVIAATGNTFKGFQPITSFYPIPAKTTEPEEPEEPDNSPVPIQALYTHIVSEIEAATVSSKDSAFKLSNISLKLKAMIQRDGDSVNASLLDLSNSENVNGNAISELVFDITPVHNRETAEGTMPDVTGLTETAVRRILKSLDLRLNPVYQHNIDVVNGDSFKQSPAVGTAIQPNQLITVIFSKYE